MCLGLLGSAGESGMSWKIQEMGQWLSIFFLSLPLRITKPFKHLIEKTAMHWEGNAAHRHSSLKCTYENLVYEYEIIVYINVYLLEFSFFMNVQRMATL